MLKRVTSGLTVTCGLSWFLGSAALAQIITYDPAAYRGVLAADSPNQSAVRVFSSLYILVNTR